MTRRLLPVQFASVISPKTKKPRSNVVITFFASSASKIGGFSVRTLAPIARKSSTKLFVSRYRYRYLTSISSPRKSSMSASYVKTLFTMKKKHASVRFAMTWLFTDIVLIQASLRKITLCVVVAKICSRLFLMKKWRAKS